jgi:hypothetical protein
LCSAGPVDPIDPVEHAALFVEGFLRGALQKDIAKVDHCLQDADSILADVGKIIEDLEGGFDILPLVSDLGKLLQDIPVSVKDCEELPEAIEETLAEWVDEIKDPEILGKILLTALAEHGKELADDATHFMDDWKSSKFEKAGEDLGDIPHILFDECAPTEINDDVILPIIDPRDVGYFLNGFLTAALQKDVTDIDRCLDNADKVADDIDQLFKDAKDFDILLIVRDLGALFQDVPKSIVGCVSIKDEVDQVLETWKSEIKNPVILAKIVYVALDKYENRLHKDHVRFHKNLKNGNFRRAGKNLGDMPHVLFDLCPQMSTVETLLKN